MSMKIVSHSLLRRGNIHTRRLAVELRLADAEQVFLSADELSRLAAAIAPLRSDVLDCPAWRRLTRATTPVPAAALVEVIAIVLQRYSFWPVKFCAWREGTGANGPQDPPQIEIAGRAVYEAGSEGVALAAGRAAVDLINALLGGAEQDQFRDQFLLNLARFVNSTNRESPSLDALHVARAASRRSIPWSVLHRSQFLRLGTGQYSHLLKGTESTNTASIHRTISRNKRLTHEILSNAGLPVARQKSAKTQQAALRQARALGFPLVVKPLDSNMGKGVSVGIKDEDHLVRAFHRAQKMSRTVILERLIEGSEYRLLVVNGRFVAAIHRQPAQVRGDGTSSVSELVQAVNSDPCRTPFLTDRTLFMRPLQLDDDALDLLKSQGLTSESVPRAGSEVLLRRESNVSRGGHPFDLTARIHPSVKKIAEQAATVTGLDVCGVDFITTDPEKDYETVGGAICEVNSRPGISAHIAAMGQAADGISDAIIDLLFPKNRPTQIPVVALVGSAGQTKRMRRDIEAVATRANKQLGVVLSSSRSTTLRSTKILKDVEALISDQNVEVAVIEITPKQLARKGFGFERIEFAVLASSDGTEAHDLAVRALERIAASRIVGADDANAISPVLEALGLPSEDASFSATRVPATIAPAVPRDPGRFTALLLGDVGLGEAYTHRRRAGKLEELLANNEPGYFFEHLNGLLQMADLKVANLEVPLAATPDTGLEGRKKYLGWCDADRTIAALKGVGIDAVTLANNHSLDCGAAGLSETMLHLSKAGIDSFGAGAEADAAASPYIRRFRVGDVERSLVVFGGFEHRSRYQNEYRWYASRRLAGVGKLAPDEIALKIAKLRQTLPLPTFVVFPHWGVDYKEVTERQRRTAAELVDAGADLVIGHGAHIVQGAEMVNGRLVIYNIGNFVWNTPGRFRKHGVPPLGLAVSLTFRPRQQEGLVLRMYPLVTDHRITGYQNRLVTEEEFACAAGLLEANPPNRFLSGKDEVGYHLSTKLTYRSPMLLGAALANQDTSPSSKSQPLPVFRRSGEAHGI